MDCIKSPDCVNIKDIQWDTITTTLSTMYGILLVCVYTAFSYTELVKFPTMNNWLEINGFFIFLYLFSSMYLIYMLIFVLKGNKQTADATERIKFVENQEVSDITISLN